MTRHPFTELELPKKSREIGADGYRIYLQDGAITLVEAATITEALAKSQAQNPLKIERVAAVEGSKQILNSLRPES